jgi:hypothetical protein
LIANNTGQASAFPRLLFANEFLPVSSAAVYPSLVAKLIKVTSATKMGLGHLEPLLSLNVGLYVGT